MSNTAWLWRYDEKIKSDSKVGVATIRTLLEQLESNQWSEKCIFGIHLALEEALMNAIKHGNQNDLRKRVHVVLTLTTVEFYARISDEGSGFDPEAIPDPTTDENLEKLSGRGLMLMRNFVDRVVYNQKGNTVELFKSKPE